MGYSAMVPAWVSRRHLNRYTHRYVRSGPYLNLFSTISQRPLYLTAWSMEFPNKSGCILLTSIGTTTDFHYPGESAASVVRGSAPPSLSASPGSVDRQ